MNELRRNYSSLKSKHEQMVKEVEEVTIKTNKLLVPQVQKLSNTDTKKDEWTVDEVTELNQQVNSLVLPRYGMPLLLRRQDNYMVSAPFYTEDEGYNMRAVAHPRNDSGTLRMVVCLCILQGKYDQVLQWPLNARFILTLYVNETNWEIEEIIFPSDKSRDDCFTNSTRDFFVIKDGSCVEYGIKSGHNITATAFRLDIVRKPSWWDFSLHLIDFMIHGSVYLWYVIVTLSS
jgi:hypothetical protein